MDKSCQLLTLSKHHQFCQEEKGKKAKLAEIRRPLSVNYILHVPHCKLSKLLHGLKVLFRLTGYKGDNIDELANSLAGEETEQESMSILKLLMERPLHLSLFVCICLHLSQQLSGMVAIFYYSTTFFQSAGLDMGTR